MALDRLRGLLRAQVEERVEPEPVTLQPIGVVRSRVRDLRYRDVRRERSSIELSGAYTPALEGLAGFSHAIVLTWLDRVSDEERVVLREHPGGDATLPAVGVFALRTHHRPNPIGMSVVAIDRVDGARVHVSGLDAIDGTPVLDIKPYLPPYDAVPEARLPAWASGAAE